MSRMLTGTALILSDDTRDPDMLESLLVASGYAAYTVSPVDDGVEVTLHETHATLVLAHVDLKRDTLAQPDDVAVLGLLQREPAFGAEHVVLILTRTPEVVETVLGAVLERLGVPVLTLPFTLDNARALLAQAQARQQQWAAVGMSQEPTTAGVS